jgi:hypothetical protein
MEIQSVAFVNVCHVRPYIRSLLLLAVHTKPGNSMEQRLEKTTVAQLVKMFSTFIEHKISLPCSQEPANGSSPEPAYSNPFLFFL